MIQVSALVPVMKSAPGAPGTDPPTTNIKNHELKRQRILHGSSVTSVVRIVQFNAVLIDDGEQQTYLDIHAGTCVIGHHELMVHNLNRPVNDIGYDPLKGTMTPNCRTVSAAFAYYCPMTGKVFIIEINQDIFIDHLHNNLLYPMKYPHLCL